MENIENLVGLEELTLNTDAQIEKVVEDFEMENNEGVIAPYPEDLNEMDFVGVQEF